VPSIRSAAPQLLVDNLSEALAFYHGRLGFTVDFVYEDFYASVSRDGAPIHLKCAPKLAAERAHRRSAEHLDAHLDVRAVRELYEELRDRGAPILKPLEERPWGAMDFYVEDPDGYILCFSEAVPTGERAGRSRSVGGSESLSRLIFIALNTSDLERSLSFYRDAFGIDFHADRNEPVADPWYGGHHAAFSWSDGAFLHLALFPASPPERPTSRDVQIGFDVGDIDSGHARAVAAGAQVVHPPRPEPWGATSRYRDPDGNLVSITQPAARREG
jgi:lactoylglutathione lyase